MNSLSVSVAIMAHEKRRGMVTELLKQIPAHVVWDDGSHGVWDTGRMAMLSYGPTADWHLVLQDDVLLCADFVGQAMKALSEAPTSVVSFYMGRRAVFGQWTSLEASMHARRQGERWVCGRGPFWGPAIAVKVSMIEEMMAWCDREQPYEIAYDYKIARYFAAKRLDCGYTVPSLVEHRDGPSMVPGRRGNSGRIAAWFSAEGCRAWK